jgi:ATP-dependent protease HslVU (ClpYQ) peptidase subunit
MTTIAYQHAGRQIAYDGRTTRGEVVINDSSEKMSERDGVKFFLCGATCDYDLLISMYFGGKSKIVPEANAFVSDGGLVYRIGCSEEGVFWKCAPDCDDAIGSGWAFAISAMDFGRCAEEAVEYAAKRDLYTGGKITVVNV